MSARALMDAMVSRAILRLAVNHRIAGHADGRQRARLQHHQLHDVVIVEIGRAHHPAQRFFIDHAQELQLIIGQAHRRAVQRQRPGPHEAGRVERPFGGASPRLIQSSRPERKSSSSATAARSTMVCRMVAH